MKQLLRIVFFTGILGHGWCQAAESTVTIPWESFNTLYRDQIKQEFKTVEPDPIPIINLEQAQYDLRVHDKQIIGRVTLTGSVQQGDPESINLFGQNIVVTQVIESQNASLIAKDGRYQLNTLQAGGFLIAFDISIPILDFQVNPRLEFEVPVAVRNELAINTSTNLSLGKNNNLHKVNNHYFFSPTKILTIDLDHEQHSIDPSSEQDTVMTQVKTPDVVLEVISFFVSFTDDGSVLSAMTLTLPPTSKNQLELDPIPGAEVWSLQVNDTARSLYRSADNKWIIPLESNTASKVTLAYLTHGKKLGLEGQLDFTIPQTGLTARHVELTVGLPNHIQMLAMDSDLQPEQVSDRELFKSFSGRPHYFSKAFYRGQELASSIIYQEPVNHVGSTQ